MMFALLTLAVVAGAMTMALSPEPNPDAMCTDDVAFAACAGIAETSAGCEEYNRLVLVGFFGDQDMDSSKEEVFNEIKAGLQANGTSVCNCFNSLVKCLEEGGCTLVEGVGAFKSFERIAAGALHARRYLSRLSLFSPLP